MSERLVARAVEQVRSRELDLAELLAAALRGNPRLRAWLARRLVGTSGTARPPRTRAPRRDARIEAALAAVRREVRGLPGLHSVHWGLRRTGGGVVSDAAAVVVVKQKRALDSVPTSQRIPRSLDFKHRGGRGRVGIDVQPAGPPGRFHADLRSSVGARVVVGRRLGTLGGFVPSGGSWSAVLSGHVARAQGSAVVARDAGGTAHSLGRVLRLQAADDAALAGPVPAEALSLATDDVYVRDPGYGDVGTHVWVEVSWDPSGRRSELSGVGVTADFDVGSFQGLVTLASAVTHDGDSGAPVRDYQGTIVGFVVGAVSGQTALMPARRVLDAIT